MTHQDALDTLASERYLLDEMSAGDREAFEQHFFSCEVCADDLRSAAAMLQGTASGLAAPAASPRVVPMVARPRVVRSQGWHGSIALPWAAAATLACVAAYQSFWIVPSLRNGAPFAVVPVMLHPASRGAEPIFSVGPGAPMVSLALEINDPPPGGEVTYDLSNADGRRIVSGRAAAPAPGTPLLLMMPSWTLVGSMHYILSVRDTGPSARVSGEYRFALSTP